MALFIEQNREALEADVIIIADSGNVKIGNACFIGSKAILHNNITIGDNCIIGSQSNVIKDVPKNAIVAGNPAKSIK